MLKPSVAKWSQVIASLKCPLDHSLRRRRKRGGKRKASLIKVNRSKHMLSELHASRGQQLQRVYIPKLPQLGNSRLASERTNERPQVFAGPLAVAWERQERYGTSMFYQAIVFANDY